MKIIIEDVKNSTTVFNVRVYDVVAKFSPATLKQYDHALSLEAEPACQSTADKL